MSYLAIRAHSADEGPVPDLPRWAYDRYDGDETLLPIWTLRVSPYGAMTFQLLGRASPVGSVQLSSGL